MPEDVAGAADLVVAAQTLAQLAAGVVLGESTPDLAERLFGRLGPLLDVDVYVHYVCDEDAGVLRLAGCGGVPPDDVPALDPLPVGEAVCGTVAALREPLAFADVPSCADGRLTLVRHLGVMAYVCHPLLAGGDLRGTLSFGSRRRSAFTADEISLMRTASDILAAALARHQAEDALVTARRDVEQLRSAMETRGVIGAAAGILMVERRCGFEEAFRMLVEASQRSNRKVRDIAEAIVRQHEADRERGRHAGRDAPTER
jgi:GAF domain-containing protein